MSRLRVVLGGIAAVVAIAGAVWAFHRPPPPPAPVPPPHVEPPHVEPPHIPEPPKPHHARAASIAGVVIDPEGKPVVGATISAVLAWTSSARYTIHSLHSGAGGAFELDGIEPGERVVVTALKAPYPPRSETIEAPAKGLRLELSRGVALDGTVSWPEHAVPRIDVSLSLGDQTVRQSKTDAHDAFHLEHLERQHYLLSGRTPAAPGSLVYVASMEVTLQSESHPVELRFPTLVTVRGLLTDEDGRPIPLAPVQLVATSEDARAEGTVATSTAGTFEESVPVGSRVELTVTKLSGYEDGTITAPVSDEPIRLVLKRELFVSGCVRTVEHQRLTAFRINGSEIAPVDGCFRLSSRELHEDSLRIEANDHAETGVPIPPHKDDIDLGDIVLSEGRTVVGRLYNQSDMEPLAGVSVGWAVDCRRHPAPKRCVLTDSDGRFTLFRVPMTTHLLWVEADGFLKTQLVLSDAPSYVEATLDHGAAIEGHVLTLAGHAVSGVDVRADGEASAGAATSDHTGRFRIAPLATGTYLLKTFADDGILSQRVTLQEHETAQVELRPPAAGTKVLVRAVDESGIPVAIGDAWAVPGDFVQKVNNSDAVNAKRLKETAFAATARAGELVVQHLPAGETTVVVERGQTPYAVLATIPPRAHYELVVRVPEAFCSLDSSGADN